MPIGVYPRSQEYLKRLKKQGFQKGCPGFLGKHSLSTKMIIGQKSLGRIPWNKGKEGVQKSWNKGNITLHKHICLNCQKEFSTKIKKSKFCSRFCCNHYYFWQGDLTNTKWKDKVFLKKNNQVMHYKRKMRFRAGGELTIKTIQQVYEDNIKQYGTLTCYLCVLPIVFGADNLEHKIPLSRGGTNEYKNLGVACSKCNRKKHNKTEEEFKKGVQNFK